MENSRYSRQLSLPQIGETGQRRLAEARVLVAGCGGLGSGVLPYLAGAGVGHIGICDHDVVSLSNLQRQVLFTTAEIGQPKCTVAAARLHALNPEIEVIPHDCRLTAGNAAELIKDYHIVIDCTDNFATRYVIDDACAALGKPWVHGAIGDFKGQIAIFNGKAGVRYADLYPDREILSEVHHGEPGVLGALPGVAGAIQAAQTIKFILGFGEQLDGTLLDFDLITNNFLLIKLK